MLLVRFSIPASVSFINMRMVDRRNFQSSTIINPRASTPAPTGLFIMQTSQRRPYIAVMLHVDVRRRQTLPTSHRAPKIGLIA
jgi:hypothetical protein